MHIYRARCTHTAAARNSDDFCRLGVERLSSGAACTVTWPPAATGAFEKQEGGRFPLPEPDPGSTRNILAEGKCHLPEGTWEAWSILDNQGSELRYKKIARYFVTITLLSNTLLTFNSFSYLKKNHKSSHEHFGFFNLFCVSLGHLVLWLVSHRHKRPNPKHGRKPESTDTAGAGTL